MEAHLPLDEARQVLESDMYRAELQGLLRETALVTNSIPLVTVAWNHQPDRRVIIQGAETTNVILQSLRSLIGTE